MKKFKKILAVLLASAVACALMVSSVSAAVPYSFNASDSGVNANCPWNSSLIMNSKKATATITVQARSSGIQPPALTATLKGMVTTAVGYHFELAKDGIVEGKSSLTITDAKDLTGTTDTIISAYCDYTAMGIRAGSRLPM